jgi:hypothetical protein
MLVCILTSIRSTNDLVRQIQDDRDAFLPPQQLLKLPILADIVKPKLPILADIVKPKDFIYDVDWDVEWDSSPIVVEKYKLIFFVIPKVACTPWKQLFRRMEGFNDWDSQDAIRGLPHNPRENGLKYLMNYNLTEASRLMTSPEYTRAVFLREPKHRFLSAFLDKAISNEGTFLIDKCCVETRDCVPGASTLKGFFKLVHTCHDSHWAPQHLRMEQKYWKYINFVGHVEHAQQDSKSLLQQIGAWDEYGKSGWGKERNSSIFGRAAMNNQDHATHSDWQIWNFYTPALERKVEQYYAGDYGNPLFNYPFTNLTKDFFVSGYNSIFQRGNWDAAPVVVEKYKLIFFTIPRVGGGKWKQAFRRMGGFEDWSEWGGPNELPHHPDHNGLKYLYHYSVEEASEMMRSNNWTRAIFLRNPKDRFMSVYHELQSWQSSNSNRNMVDDLCCPEEHGCANHLSSMVRFLDLIQGCNSTQWEPQWHRMEKKYWKYINFIGKIDNVEEDSKRLLKQIGAWDAIGKSGWGADGSETMFTKDGHELDHVRTALGIYSPVVDRLVETFYRDDYDNKIFNFTKKVSTFKSSGRKK